MKDTTLGAIINGEAFRDAIHIAVAPVIAGCKLKPGQHVGFKEGSTSVVTRNSKVYIGIVDPFIDPLRPVCKDDRFFICLYPKTVTSLRHSWTHQAFPAEEAAVVTEARPVESPEQGYARTWIEELANRLDISYNDLMGFAGAWLATEDYAVQNGSESWRNDFPVYAAEFWENYETVTGVAVPAAQRSSFFSCSC